MNMNELLQSPVLWTVINSSNLYNGMKFKAWLEVDEQPVVPPVTPKKLGDYLHDLGLPIGLAKQPNAYQLLEQAYKAQETAPGARDAYVKLHAYLDRQQGGKHFDKFFTDVTQGNQTYVPQAEHKPVYGMAEHADWTQAREQYHGNFDKHIKTSIPTFGEIQDKKGHAIVRAFGDRELDMLDIGGSEGSFARTISHLTKGKIRTEVLDPNDAMHDFYKSKGETPGSTYNKAAFIKGWINDDGSKMPELNSKTTTKRYDIIHEAMAFQFISNQRDSQVDEVKALLKPGGLFLTEQKLKNDNWDANEAFKDKNHKDLYYSKDALAKKDKVVAFAAEKKPFSQDKDEEEAVGMVNNMVHHDEYERTLGSKFAVVYQYWDSGNFKGYAASDQGYMVTKFVQALGPVQSKFSNVELPRKIEAMQETTMPTYKQWLETHNIEGILGEILPPMDELCKMTRKAIIEKYGNKILHALKSHDIEFSEDDLNQLIDKAAGCEDMPEPHHSHYHLHT